MMLDRSEGKFAYHPMEIEENQVSPHKNITTSHSKAQ